MDLRNKNIYIPGFVPGETKEEMVLCVILRMLKVSSAREMHIMRCTKRSRIRKKYCDRIRERAIGSILCEEIEKHIAELEKADGQNKSAVADEKESCL